MRVQMEHVCRAWGRVPLEVLQLEDHRKLFETTEIWPIILTSDADRARSLGWHTKFAGSVFSYVFVKTVFESGGAFLRGTEFTLAGVAGHEEAEMTINPDLSLFVQLPRELYVPEGDMVAMEVGDPVQDEYEVKAGFLGLREPVQISNFVHRSWFQQEPHAPGTLFDEKGQLKAPFTTLPSGYRIIKDSRTGVVSSVFDSKTRPWKKHEFSRTFRICERTAAHAAKI